MLNFIAHAPRVVARRIGHRASAECALASRRALRARRGGLVRICRPLPLAGFLALGSIAAQAGNVYTDPILFGEAVAGMPRAWFESFEGFPLGEATNPLMIGGGKAQYTQKTVNNSRSNIKNNLTVNELYIEGPLDNEPRIDGTGDPIVLVTGFSLLVGAPQGVNLIFGSSVPGSDLQFVFPVALGGPINFIGWVGSMPDETLVSLRAVGTKGINGNIVEMDNIEAFGVTVPSVPEPGSVALFAAGLVGVVFKTWRSRLTTRRCVAE